MKARHTIGAVMAVCAVGTFWACDDGETEPGSSVDASSSGGSSSGATSSGSSSGAASSGGQDGGTSSSGGSSSGEVDASADAGDDAGLGAATPSIAVGGELACALRSDGTVWCWGRNESYALGNGEDSRGVFAEPTAVRSPDGSGTLDHVVGLDAGLNHVCALRDDSTVWCWGNNLWGKLGDGTQTERGLPVQVRRADGTPLTDARAVYAGYDNSCAIVGDEREAQCWGWNGTGQLGQGPGADGIALGAVTVRSHDGQSVMNRARGIGLGAGFLCVASERIWSDYGPDMGPGGVWCVGQHNAHMQLGDGNSAGTPRNGYPVAVRTPQGDAWLSGIHRVSSGELHSCVVWRGEHVTCWGGSTTGQRGSTGGDPFGPVDAGPPSFARPNVTPLLGQLLAEGAIGERDVEPREISTNGGTTCVIVDVVDNEAPATVLSRGEVRCMGADFQGGLGDGSIASGARGAFGKVAAVDDPTGAMPLTHAVKLAAGGGSTTCALLEDGTIACWGPGAGWIMGAHAAIATEASTPTRVVHADGTPFVLD